MRPGDGARFVDDEGVALVVPFMVTLWAPGDAQPVPGRSEIVEVLSYEGDTITDCVRGAEYIGGTNVPCAIVAGWQVGVALTAGQYKSVSGGGGGGSLEIGASVASATASALLGADSSGDLASGPATESVVTVTSGAAPQMDWSSGTDQQGFVKDVSSGLLLPVSLLDLPSGFTTADLLVGASSGAALARLPVGSDGQVVTVVEGAPAYATPGVTSATALVISGTPVSGEVLTATSGSAAEWASPAGGGGGPPVAQSGLSMLVLGSGDPGNTPFTTPAATGYIGGGWLYIPAGCPTITGVGCDCRNAGTGFTIRFALVADGGGTPGAAVTHDFNPTTATTVGGTGFVGITSLAVTPPAAGWYWVLALVQGAGTMPAFTPLSLASGGQYPANGSGSNPWAKYAGWQSSHGGVTTISAAWVSWSGAPPGTPGDGEYAGDGPIACGLLF